MGLSRKLETQTLIQIFLLCLFEHSNPRITPLPGIEKFKGEVIHPAMWTDDINVEGKRVALIGYGCTFLPVHLVAPLTFQQVVEFKLPPT